MNEALYKTWHSLLAPGVIVCGANEPNQSATEITSKVNCASCLRIAKEIPYNCRHCKSPLGLSSDKSLSVGQVKIVQPVKLQCGHCGQKITWRPELAKIRIPIPAYPVY